MQDEQFDSDSEQVLHFWLQVLQMPLTGVSLGLRQEAPHLLSVRRTKGSVQLKHFSGSSKQVEQGNWQGTQVEPVTTVKPSSQELTHLLVLRSNFMFLSQVVQWSMVPEQVLQLFEHQSHLSPFVMVVSAGQLSRQLLSSNLSVP